MTDFLFAFSCSLVVLCVFLGCAGCKFCIKEYSSSIGELSAETIKGH